MLIVFVWCEEMSDKRDKTKLSELYYSPVMNYQELLWSKVESLTESSIATRKQSLWFHLNSEPFTDIMRRKYTNSMYYNSVVPQYCGTTTRDLPSDGRPNRRFSPRSGNNHNALKATATTPPIPSAPPPPRPPPSPPLHPPFCPPPPNKSLSV